MRRSGTINGRMRRTSTLDPQRTSLSGYAGRVFLNRNSGVWRVNAALWGVSPGFESNDLGFHSRGDRAGAHSVLLWRNQTPDRFSRFRGMVARESVDLEFQPRDAERHLDGMRERNADELLERQFVRRLHTRTMKDDLTRGGPPTENPQGNWANVGFSTDGRKWLSFDAWAGRDWNEPAASATMASCRSTSNRCHRSRSRRGRRFSIRSTRRNTFVLKTT